jgi:hypothetical protein
MMLVRPAPPAAPHAIESSIREVLAHPWTFLEPSIRPRRMRAHLR